MDFITAKSENKLDAIVKEEDINNILKYMGDFFNEGFISKIFNNAGNENKEKEQVKANDRDDIIKEIENIRNIEKSTKENQEKTKRDYSNHEKPKPYLVKYYYNSIFQKKQLYNFYVYMPGGLVLERVSHHVLGPGVLGRAFPGLNLVQIRDDLYGNDFEEVKKHEVNHILFPYLNELEIRMRTKSELPFYTRFH